MEGGNNTTNNTPPVSNQTTGPMPVKERIMKPLQKTKKMVDPKMFMIGALVILGGIGSGWLLAGRPSGAVLSGSTDGAPEAENVDGGVGIADEATFRDTAEGTLEVGGIDGEGTHHLVREGGESKYVYLTSTVIDLEGFAGKKVQVWGETISARKAGWLMDVGKVKVTE